MALTTGSTLGRYRLESLLGTGGMASVWRARDERLGRTVAVKVLSETLALDRQFIERFVREARVAAGLSHPNLVPVFDFNADGERPYLVSEFVEGGTLAERIEAGSGIDAERLAAQLLAALAHIHSAGVVHRDVKPANILIDPDGQSRLTDFGVARPEGGHKLTETGKVVGTLAYMAPEVREGEAATKPSDLYSCGVVIRECFGESPSPAMAALADRLTAPNPADRPRSAKTALKQVEVDPEAATRLAVTEPLPQRKRRAGALAVGSAPTLGRLRSRPGLAFAGMLAVALLGFVLAGALGGNGGAAQQSIAVKPPKTQPTQTQLPATAPEPTATAVALTGCAALEERKHQLEEAWKNNESPGHGGEPPGQLKHQFDEQKHALDEQLKSCKKADEGGGGHEKGD